MHKLLTLNGMQLYSAQVTCMRITRSAALDWSAGVFYVIYCQPCFLCKFLVQKNP